MNMIKILKIAVSTFLGISLIVILLIWYAVPDFEPQVTILELKSITNKDSIYLKRKAWGLLGDQNITIISTTNDNNFDKSSEFDFIFNDNYELFYRLEDTVLLIWVDKKVLYPNNFNSKIIVKQIVLWGPQWTQLRDNMHSNGVNKF